MIFPVPEIYPQCVVGVLGQGVDVLVAQPELRVDVAEPKGVVVPVAGEVEAAVLAALYEGPAAVVRVHVAVDVEHETAGQLDGVHPAHHHPAHLQLVTVCTHTVTHFSTLPSTASTPAKLEGITPPVSVDEHTVTNFPAIVFTRVSQSVSQSVRQAANQPASQSVGQSVSQSVSRSARQAVNQAGSQPASQSISQAQRQSVSQSVSQSARQSVNQSGRKAVSQSVSQSIRQSVSQAVSQSVRPKGSQSDCQSVGQSVRQAVRQPGSQSVSQSVRPKGSQAGRQAVDQSVRQTDRQAGMESVSQPVMQAVRQSGSQSVSQSASQAVSQTVSQSASHAGSQTVRQAVSHGLMAVQSLTSGDGHALECRKSCARVDVGAMIPPLQLAHQTVLHSVDTTEDKQHKEHNSLYASAGHSLRKGETPFKTYSFLRGFVFKCKSADFEVSFEIVLAGN